MSMKGEQLFNEALQTAYQNRASDIHIERSREGLVFRLRINNDLYHHATQPDDEIIANAFRHIRKRCGFNSGSDGIPLDSAFGTDDPPCDYRCNLMPTKFGEKIVLRLLRRDMKFDLKNCQLPEDALRDLTSALDRWQGIIVTSGPTGSGKTTLLYSILSSLIDKKTNVHTLEHPIEYSLDGLNQTEISDKLSFAAGLRGLMRQDIDAIMVGEVRDVETATAATYAASTGHMVLTTIHANSAQEIFTRLGLLGANVELFAANVSFASAQRLVEINCTHCAQDETKEQSLWAQTFFKDPNLIPKSGRGCANCNGTGIAGRKLIIEWLSRSPQGELTQKGVLKDDVFKLVKAGMVSSKKAGEVV